MKFTLLACANLRHDATKIVAVATIDGSILIMHHNAHLGYFVYDQDQKLPKESVQAFADRIFEPTRCQHSHDCCGHYYLQSNTVQWNEDEPEGDMWKITSNYIQNI